MTKHSVSNDRVGVIKLVQCERLSNGQIRAPCCCCIQGTVLPQILRNIEIVKKMEILMRMPQYLLKNRPSYIANRLRNRVFNNKTCIMYQCPHNECTKGQVTCAGSVKSHGQG